MPRSILITGGAGFIGSHLADDLLGHGHKVRILDSLNAQVHGLGGVRPDYLNPDAELLIGDMRDPAAIRRALRGIDAVFHLAAMVGVGQSMYQVDEYVAVNDLGTANLLQCLIDQPVERLIVASSMSVYGEGLYTDHEGRPAVAVERTPEQLARSDWEPRDAMGRPLRPVATPEDKPPTLASVYALSKFVQERMCLVVGRAYGIATSALRFFNVYGTRQALSNPYTGVLAIFGARLLNNRPPMIFEDGEQRRDFVHVRDVARACRLAMETPAAAGRVLNIGSGEAHTVAEIARKLATAMGRQGLRPVLTGRSRVGDIRHCFADIALARDLLGYRPGVTLEAGMAELALWMEEQIALDRVDQATHELVSRGLVA